MVKPKSKWRLELGRAHYRRWALLVEFPGAEQRSYVGVAGPLPAQINIDLVVFRRKKDVRRLTATRAGRNYNELFTKYRDVIAFVRSMPDPHDSPTKRGYSDKPLHHYPWWALRFWHGMDFFTFAKLLFRNRFAVSPRRWPLVASVAAASLLNSGSGVFEWFLYSDRVRSVKLREPPLFVLGHWRSGTTLLHELLMLDARHTCPTTYQCLAPHDFLWTSWFIPALASMLLPKQRPMDDVAAGFDRPQEDEFALANMGVPSPYLAWAFPNHGPVYDEYLDLRTLPPAEREEWKGKWREFVHRVAVANNRRIVLKSPTHTARVRTILEVFPDAKFIHIVRNPLVIYPSTVRLWKSLSEVQGFQIPHGDAGWIENTVLDNFVRMYGCFEQDRDLIPPGRLVDIRYEELVADPVGEMRQVYQRLDLGDFAGVETELMRHAMKSRGYRPNKYKLPEDVAERVRGRWAPYFQRYGYDERDVATAIA